MVVSTYGLEPAVGGVDVREGPARLVSGTRDARGLGRVHRHPHTCRYHFPHACTRPPQSQEIKLIVLNKTKMSDALGQ